nr:DEAD/DEAH box helicase [Planctomycetota bacterium]
MPTTPATFTDLGLAPAILAGVTEAGFTVPSPIQALAIPIALQGRDLIAQARTGTGKTAAFGLPAMSRLLENGVPKRGVGLLVITPTRELCAQVSEEIYRLGRHAGIKTCAVYGGTSGGRQLEMIARGANVVVATPGRLLDHLSSGYLKNFAPSTVVLDEADEMLDMGFLEDIEAIFKHLPAERQTMLFSATMPPAIRGLATRILKNPETIDLTTGTVFETDVEQRFYVIEEGERGDAIMRLIDADEPEKAIVFCRTRIETEHLCDVLIAHGCSAKALHGDIDQSMRQNTLRSFREGRMSILVATDVAARGLDVSDVTHVYNFHLPFDQEAYVHRIGRTGRAGRKGIAITLVTPFEYRKLRRIQSAIKASFVAGEIPTIGDVRKKHEAKLVAVVCKQP